MDLSGVSGFHEIIVLTPRGFEEGLDAVMAVREQRTVLLNLSEMEAKLAQRTADFVSGGVYATAGASSSCASETVSVNSNRLVGNGFSLM